MASSIITSSNIKMVLTSSPTTDQLKNAQIVLTYIQLHGTLSKTVTVNFVGDGDLVLGLTDRSGTRVLVASRWDKTNGTLIAEAEGTNVADIINVGLIF